MPQRFFEVLQGRGAGQSGVVVRPESELNIRVYSMAAGKAAVDDVIQAAKAENEGLRAGAAGGQLDLLAARDPELDFIPSTERLDLNNKEQLDRERRRGRPAGSTNRRTLEFSKLIERTIGSPNAWRAQWLRMTPEEFGHRFGCSTLEALDRQDRIADALAPYVDAKRAPVGSDGKDVLPVIAFPGYAPPGAAAGQTIPPWELAKMVNAEIVQNQGDSEPDEPQSRDNQSPQDGEP